MGNPLDNLGDYAKINDDLKLFDGSKEKLYQSIADTAVSKATPKLLVEGGVITALLFGLSYASYKGICFMRERKMKIECEPVLKRQFFESVDSSEEIERKGDEAVE